MCYDALTLFPFSVYVTTSDLVTITNHYDYHAITPSRSQNTISLEINYSNDILGHYLGRITNRPSFLHPPPHSSYPSGPFLAASLPS